MYGFCILMYLECCNCFDLVMLTFNNNSCFYVIVEKNRYLLK